MSKTIQKVCLIIDRRYPNSEPRSIEYGDWIDGDTDYIRVSEVAEAEFDMLPAKDVVHQQLAGIQDLFDEETERHAVVVANLEEQKSKLLALPNLSEE